MFHSNFFLRIKNFALLTLLFIVVGFQSGCDYRNELTNTVKIASSGDEMNKKLSIEVEVVAFKAGAIHDDFEGGVSVSYDLTLLTVLEPGIHHGKEIKIVHPNDSAAVPWTLVGRRFVLNMEDWLLDDAAAFIPASNVEIQQDKVR